MDQSIAICVRMYAYMYARKAMEVPSLEQHPHRNPSNMKVQRSMGVASVEESVASTVSLSLGAFLRGPILPEFIVLFTSRF